jgi:hypothetical protein
MGALVLTALGLYCAGGVLDIVGTSSHVVRVAMLPPWWQLVALIVALGATGFAASRAGREPDIVLPLCVLSVLALPFLPWLPDRLPVLRGFAGPGSTLIWFVVCWLVIIRIPHPIAIARVVQIPDRHEPIRPLR